MASRGLFGFSPPHMQPLTPVSEVSEPPETPYPELEQNSDVPAPEFEDEDVGEGEEAESPPDSVPFWGLFASADGFDWILMSLGSVAAAAHGAAPVVYLHLFGKLIQLLASDHPERSDELFDKLTQHALYIIYIAAGVFVAGWLEVSCWILTGERQTAVIRSKYVKVLLNQDMSFFDTYGNNGDIVSQVLSDVLLIQSALSEKVGNYIHNMATFFSGLIFGFVNCWQIALITFATGPFVVAAGGVSNIFLHKLAENIQDAYSESASIAEQAVSNSRTLYAFANETLAKYSYATSLQATLRYGILISLVQGLGLGFTYGLAICSCALQLWVGGFLITSGKSNGGEIIAALFAMVLSGLGLNQAATNFYSFEQGRIAAFRLYAMISRSSSTANGDDGNTLVSVQGVIEFRNVYFSYPSRAEIPVLSEFYLTIPAKKFVALVGRNGSGKSSIIPLIERYYDPNLGEVLLDGENIKNLKLEWLRNQIGLVTQEPALLSLSIRDNIAYGLFSATSDQIEEAAKVAHLHTFISSLEKGYDTEVGRFGLTLTEEQKVKLSIARAVLSNPSILLLDEVTRNLNVLEESAVMEAIDIIVLGKSTIMVARKLSLVKNADYIAVMDEGQLVEGGTHDQLLSSDGLYAELVRYEEAVKLPERMPSRKVTDASTHMENDLSSSASKNNSISSYTPQTEFPGLSLDSKKEKNGHKPPSFWRLVKLSSAEWLYALLGSIGAAIFGSFNPLLAYMFSLIVITYCKASEPNHNVREEVNRWCLLITCMGVVTLVANFLQHFYFGIMGEKMVERVRRMMFSAMLRNEVGWFDEEENSADNLSLLLANDATFVRAAFSNRLSIFIQDGAAVIVAVLIGMLLEWRLALVALATLPILTVSAIAQKMWLSGFSRGIQELHRKASLVLEDAVKNIHAVVAFNGGKKVIQLYKSQLNKIYNQSFLQGTSIGFAFAFSQFLLFACNSLLLYYTAISIKNSYTDSHTALKEYIVFSFATFALVEPFGLAPYILKRRDSLTKVFRIIDRVPSIDPDDTSALKPANVYGSIEFKNVDFCYPTLKEVMVLNNFSLKVNGGQTLAVVGVSGSGKSTIISLLERFYDPVSGQIFLDGKDLKTFNLRWLRNQMGLIQQEPVIFSTTIRENIIYARHNATEAEIKEAARIANAHHFISSLPHGYDTHVGMRGVDLTPGQKQRIVIARVVLKNAPILLLDEASSAIESESSRVVQEALGTLIMGNKTTVIVAHRAAMMRHVDNIVVVNGGRIVEQGTHDSLVANKGLYVRLMQPHFAKGLRHNWLG